ncbi:MAG: integrin alpha [Chthoniobacteraceae bacterium]
MNAASSIEPLECRIAPAAIVINLADLTGADGFDINGESNLDRFGSGVSGAGDVNGDGFDDLIIGAYGADPNGPDSGASYVIFGKPNGFGPTLDLSSLDGNNGFKILGEAAFDSSGRSVSGAGDVNGDGFDDLIIGAAGADPNGPDSGASYVAFGKAGGFGATLNLSSLDGTNGFKLQGGAISDGSGFSVSGAGDVNGDGFDDLIVGAPHNVTFGSFPGESYVVFGKANGFGNTLNLESLDGTNGFKLQGEAAADATGWSVSAAGDINGDGFDDLIIGAPFADPFGNYSGAIYVVFGKGNGFETTLALSSLDGTTGFKLEGGAGREYAGMSVSGAGDVMGTASTT